MTTYRLCDELGAHPCVQYGVAAGGDWTVIVDPVGGDSYKLTLPRHKLVEVKPPLPEEPPDGSAVFDKDGDPWVRKESGDGKPWIHGGLDLDWSRLNEKYGPLTVLIPDPVANAPELPYSRNVADGTWLRVELRRATGDLFIGADDTRLSPHEAERFAFAILRAVREVRKP